MRRVRNLSVAGVLTGLLVSATTGAMAQDGAIITVAADGSADHETISAAIEAASAGDTIRIAPGTYVEHLEIDKDLTISGQGDRADVIIEPPDDQERRLVGDQMAYDLIWAEGVDVTLEGFTLGERFGYAIVITDGTATIRDVLVPDTILTLAGSTATIEDSDLMLLEFGEASEVAVRDSTLRNGTFVWDGAIGVFEDNEVLDKPIVADGGANITVIGNTFAPTEDEAGVLVFDPESVGTVIDNTFTGGSIGIVFEYAVESLAEGNTITDAYDGVAVVESGSVIRDNTITGATGYGVHTVGEGMTIEGNLIEGGRAGLYAMLLPPPAHPRATDYQAGPFVRGNTITGTTHFGVLVDEAPIELSDNVICGARESLRLQGESNLVLGTNEICEPEAD